MRKSVIFMLLIFSLLLFVMGCSSESEGVTVSDQVDQASDDQMQDQVQPESQDSQEGAQEQVDEQDDESIEPEEQEESTQEEQEQQQEVQEQVEPESQEAAHVVSVSTDGFSPATITIKEGQSVTWNNNREGRLSDLLILGVRFPCADLKSELLKPGESHTHVFNDVGKCVVIDAITTTQKSTIVIE